MKKLSLYVLPLFFFLFSQAQDSSKADLDSSSVTLEETQVSTGKKRVYKFDVKEEIGPPIWRKMQKAFDEANDWEADLILLHMNTYGGMVIHADSMRTKILNSKIPVWVFIDNNAASALVADLRDLVEGRDGGLQFDWRGVNIIRNKVFNFHSFSKSKYLILNLFIIIYL